MSQPSLPATDEHGRDGSTHHPGDGAHHRWDHRTRRRWWLLPVVVVVAWLLFGALGGGYLGKLADVQRNDNASFLPADAESTRVLEEQRRFTDAQVLPAIAVFSAENPLTVQQRATITQHVREVSGHPGLLGAVTGPTFSPDGRAAKAVLPVDGSDGHRAGEIVTDLRADLARDLPTGLTLEVTGPGGYAADFGSAFEGIDGRLLGITALVVAVILVAVYRSPLLPIIVLACAGLSLALASVIVYHLARAEVLTLNGQTQGILLILVFGAATDYALLLVSRYREMLRGDENEVAAMRSAWRASLEPIGASAATVIAGMLCLVISELESNSALGPIAAIGIACSALGALTFLPCSLILMGRKAFWPLVPAVGSTERTGRAYRGIATAVGRSPRRIWLVTALGLLVCTAFLPMFQASGVAQRETFLTPVQAVTGEDTLHTHFPDSGGGSPAIVVTDADQLPQVLDALSVVDGVSAVLPKNEPGTDQPMVVGSRAMIAVQLSESSTSTAGLTIIQDIRTAVHGVAGADAIVGGSGASQLDVQEAATRDRTLIIPLVLIVVGLILGLLLRSLIAPLVLLATVVLSFAATLGVGALVFRALGFPGSDPSVPLYAFVFLVALGIDYNIFLMARVREEAFLVGTRAGTLRALSVTGGVITSAGVVLAATFASLAVLPILFMAQIAFLVSFGVLLDTMIVRSLLVPALTIDIGRRLWWPGRLAAK